MMIFLTNAINTESSHWSQSPIMRPPLHLAKTYDGWVNRKMIGFYERYVRTIFARYGKKVKYWLTFNEINSVLHEPFLSGGIYTEKDKLSQQDLYQAVHHELVASALAHKDRT